MTDRSDRIAEIMARPAPEGVRPDVQHFLNQNAALKVLRPDIEVQARRYESGVGSLEKLLGTFDELQKGHPGTRVPMSSLPASRDSLAKAAGTCRKMLGDIDAMTSAPLPLWMQQMVEGRSRQ